MARHSSVEEALGIEQLRAGLLEYSRQAWALVPAFDGRRILDIGCGSGLPTIELARLSHGEVVGIDTDESALAGLRQRIEAARLAERVSAVNASLYHTGFPDESFDLIWDEGLLHVLDPARSFRECHRLLNVGGILTIGETVAWFETVRERLDDFGFQLLGQHLLPRHCWWTEYYAPLERRIRDLREGGAALDPVALARYKHEIAMVKRDPGRFDCGFYLARKVTPRGPQRR